jgi:hypothetical protein
MQTGAIIETWRNASRAWVLDRCNSITGSSRSGDRVAQRDRGMGVGPGVQDHASRGPTRGLKRIDKRAFVIALLEGNGGDVFVSEDPALRLDIGQCRTTVDLGLAGAEKIQVRSVQNEDVHVKVFLRRAVYGLDRQGKGDAGGKGDVYGRRHGSNAALSDISP